jgi:poly-gamma-glutamate synthesis protein (capsule biosynthesis protein)
MSNIETLDWESGCWENDAVSDARAELLIASDWAPIRAYSNIILNDPESVYGDLLPDLRQSDLRITNLECPLVDRESAVWKSGSVLRGEVNHVGGLKAVPFEVVTLGNNHVFDHGVTAFEKTLALLDDRGIKTVGAGMSAEDAKRPLIIEVNKIRIAIISFSEGEDLTAAVDGPGVFGWEIDAVADIVEQLKNTIDFVSVISHCGVEYIPFPPPYVAGAFQRIVDAGADLVIGHHPHVPQGIQIYNQSPICYSLGNFVFFQETDLQFRKVGFFVKVGVAKEGVAYLKSIPYRINPEGLRLLQNDRRRWFFEKLKAVSLPLHDVANIEDAWHGYLRYCGIAGLQDEIKMILDQLKGEPEKGAAMLRNRITTIQHYRHWTDILTRIINGDIDTSPQWAYDLVEEWLTKNT